MGELRITSFNVVCVIAFNKLMDNQKGYVQTLY